MKEEKSDFESPFPTESKKVKPEILEAPSRTKFIKFEEQEKLKTSDFIASLTPHSEKAEVSVKVEVKNVNLS